MSVNESKFASDTPSNKMSKQPPGVIIGQKGTQYGLQKVVPKKPGLQVAPGAQRKVAPTNVFGDDDSEEEDVERQISRQADKKRAAAKVRATGPRTAPGSLNSSARTLPDMSRARILCA